MRSDYWEHQIKRAILCLTLITILAGSRLKAHDEPAKACYKAHLTNGHAWLEQIPCEPTKPKSDPIIAKPKPPEPVRKG